MGASALRVRVADPGEFANARNFAAFLGLVPGHRGMGGKLRLGDKQDGESRWLRGIVERRGFNVACVALAHKNARQAWAIMARREAAVH